MNKHLDHAVLAARVADDMQHESSRTEEVAVILLTSAIAHALIAIAQRLEGSEL